MRKVFVPYRERRHPVWPNGARMVVEFNVAIEEWDATTIAERRATPNLAPKLLPGAKTADTAIMTTVEYGFRVGIYRLIEIWDEFDLKPSVVASGIAVERHPELFRELVDNGYGMVGHGYDQTWHMAELSLQDQSSTIDRCVGIFQSQLSVGLEGWGSPGTRQFPETLELLGNAGFTFHVGFHDDELPYFVELDNGHRLVEIPYRAGGNTGEPRDFAMYGPEHHRTWREAVAYMKDYFDARYEMAKEKPALFAVAMHPYVSGRADRALALKHFIRYVRGFPDVWVSNYHDIVAWWEREHAPRNGGR